MSTQPSGVRRSSRTVEPSRTSAPDARATAARQPAQAAARGCRTPARRPAGRLPSGAGGRQQRALPTGVRRELRHGRVEGQQVGAARVDAAEQRLDQPVHDRPAQPGTDEPADRDVVADVCRGQPPVERDPGELPRCEQAAGRERAQVGRHSHHRAGGHRTQATAAPDGRGRGRCIDQVRAEAGGSHQRRPLGATQQQRLGALVDRHAGDVGDPQLAADRGRPSSTVTRRSGPPGRADSRCRNQAAASPEMPPPTTTTCRCADPLIATRSCRQSHNGHDPRS